MKRITLINVLITIYSLLLSVNTFAINNDFIRNKNTWQPVKSANPKTKERMLTIRESKNSIEMLKRLAPGSRADLGAHKQHEYIIITQGTLDWLNEDGSVQKKLVVGDFVDRKPNVDHGPFVAGPEGCTMYIKFYN